MKKLFGTIIILICLAVSCLGQMEIKIHIENAQYDTVAIQKYIKDFENVIVQKGNNDMLFESKQPLEPGLYFITGDKKIIGTFIISDRKNQKFAIEVNNGALQFTNSLDNDQYNNYLQKIQRFDARLDSLKQVYAQASATMPQYMLAPLVERLTEEANHINKEKRDFQYQTGEDLKGTLTATIARASIQIPDIPDSIKNQTVKIQRYLLGHFFDNFPWEDPRVFNTAYGRTRIQEFTSMLIQFKNPDFGNYVVDALQAAKVDTNSYFIFFDQLEAVIGNHESPMRMEGVYIQMLKNMQTLPKLPAYRARHCKYELSKIDINHEGSLAPDFKMVTNNGDTTSLYGIQCDYMLLYLQHPTCPTCQNVRKMMADFPVLNKAIASGHLKVLMVYFEDEAQVWNDYIHSSEANPTYLHSWNYDQTIEQMNLYDTRAIPYMFLLDKDKRIIKKNVMETELENEIRKLHIAY